MDIPEKLTPIPKFNRDVLPKWVLDFGTIEPCDELPEGAIVMTTRLPNGDLVHVDAVRDIPNQFDEDFGERFVRPMIDCLGGMIFDAEYPGAYEVGGIFIDCMRRQYAGEALTGQEQAMVDRKFELMTKQVFSNVFLD